jgi:ATP-dependent helicase/nuclease subunit A
MGSETFQPTPQQLEAITTVGQSVIVSAAAGAGKTAVLARRCAHLVCDAPADARCDVDNLLVLTFTDAAAAEMRMRIVKAIRERQAEQPGDERLARQVALADVAQISTIHSFCLWVMRRWFNEIGIDPTATLLDGDESPLLSGEVLDQLFSELYATVRDADDPLGAKVLTAEAKGERDADVFDICNWTLGERSVEALGPAFVRLVDDYGLGEDQAIRKLVADLSSFLGSLPDPGDWLTQTVHRHAASRDEVIEPIARAMVAELARQVDHCEALAGGIELGDPVGHSYALQIRDYAELVRGWFDRLSADASAKEFDRVRVEISETELPRAKSLKKKELDDRTLSVGEYAQACFTKQVKDKLFKNNLRNRFGLFSPDEWVAGMRRVGPFVATIADLAVMFRERYDAQKRKLNVLDFGDLERFAFELLCDRDASKRAGGTLVPSDIAKNLHRRFRYVLVDEFQDINPLQEAILQLASHESDETLPGNLFTVGDVKQSIYRFRLAEPKIFSDRLGTATGGGEADAIWAIFLQENFRSRPEILEGVNFVFREVMRAGSGPVVYDEMAELRPGRALDEDAAVRGSVEVHVLEAKMDRATSDDDGEETSSDASPFAIGTARHTDSSQWSKMEREAYCIGERISDLMRGSADDAEPIRYRDVAILLRSKKVNADLVANVLGAMNIPAFSDAGGSLFSALEVRDVLSALRVLDNMQQDIPLAATLRSGILGEPLTEDQLVAIRMIDRALPFHQTVRTYAASGGDENLRRQLEKTLAVIERYRVMARRKPLAEVIWKLYEERAHFARACGLENGSQRRANLLKLHDIARRFATFRNQGLSRFLRFMENLQEQDRDFDVAPTIGESEDVVRIMTIHQSKGLEFPVVFLAGMGNQFNLQDERGRTLFARSAGVGLRVVEPDRMIEYSSASHLRARLEITRSSREEELRVLYVAMTRARDRLILVGSKDGAEKLTDENASPVLAHTAHSIGSASSYFDWVLPVLAADDGIAVAGLAQSVKRDPASPPLFDVTVHGAFEMTNWSLAKTTDPSRAAILQSVSRLEPLPETEPLVEGDAQVQRVMDRLDFVYPHLASTSVRAAVAASQFKGDYDYTKEDEFATDRRGDAQDDGGDDFSFPPSRYDQGEASGAAVRGTITHRVLQFLDFVVATDTAGVEKELQRLVDTGKLSNEDREAVSVESLAWFVTTPLAERVRSAGKAYRREFRFVTTEPAQFFDPAVDEASGDRVLVRGIADGVLVGEDEIELIDFKTDAIGDGDLDSRVAYYKPQMVMYARAISRLWRLPVRAASLVFLTPRVVAEIADLDMDAVARHHTS